jgi:hypothetical protein
MLSKVLWVLPIACAPAVVPQSAEPPSRETLTYNIEWRLITAGKATVEWSPASDPRGQSRVNLRVQSVGLVSKLFKVDDNYSALLRPGYCVEAAQATIIEGSRHRETRIVFDSESRKASYHERDLAKNRDVASVETDIPACTHDVTGGLLYLRTLTLEPGQSVQVPVSDGKKSVMAKVEAQAREDVKTPAGTFHTMRYEIYLFNDVLYRRSGHLNVWVSEDRARLPVQIRARMQITTGTITLQLEKHETGTGRPAAAGQ